jgi:uncharacterized membrane protein
MKNITKIVIIAEFFDFLTTLIGLNLFPMHEVNPLFNIFGQNLTILFLFKLIMVLFVVFMLEKHEKWESKIIWAVPITAIIPVIMNVGSIITEIISKI